MADDEDDGEEYAQPGKGRAAYGNLHKNVYREAFKKALDGLTEVYPEKNLTGKMREIQISLIIQTLASRFKEGADDIFHEEIKKLDNKKALDDEEPKCSVLKRWTRFKDCIVKICKGTYEGRNLPQYMKLSISAHPHPKMRALLARMIIVKHNHAFARRKRWQATLGSWEQHDFLTPNPCDPDPPSAFAEFDFDAAHVADPVAPPPPPPAQLPLPPPPLPVPAPAPAPPPVLPPPPPPPVAAPAPAQAVPQQPAGGNGVKERRIARDAGPSSKKLKISTNTSSLPAGGTARIQFASGQAPRRKRHGPKLSHSKKKPKK
jgi:hypothetical protein